jgi:hypothetical protein
MVQPIQALKQKLDQMYQQEDLERVASRQLICIQQIHKRFRIPKIKEQYVTEVEINNIPEFKQQLIKTQ